MEQLIPASKQSEEQAFVKRHLDALATQRKKYADDYSPTERKRAKRAPIAAISVVAPPELVTRSSALAEATAATTTVTLSIKSTKPALAYTLTCSTTSSIATLKEQLHTEQKGGAPPPDAQRWVLNGKALADNKLLSEYDIAEGAKIFLMVSKGWTPLESAGAGAKDAPAVGQAIDIPNVPSPLPLPSPALEAPSSIKPASRGHIRVPSLQLERADSFDSTGSGSANRSTSPTLIPLDDYISKPNAPHPAPAGVSAAFLDTITSPSLWTDTHAMLIERFKGDEEAARKVFEAWFGSTKIWLTPSQISKIRDETGITGMAGH